MAGAEVAEGRRSDLGRRAAVGAVAAIVAILALALGGIWLWALAAVVAMIAAAEWGVLVRADRIRFVLALGVLGAGLAVAAPMLWGTDRSSVATLLILALLSMLVPRTAFMAWGVAYVGLAAIGLMYLRDQPNGFALALWTLLIVWATDIGAYFAGRRFGGPKLAPRVSPNKTWAGLAGGVVAAAIVGGIFGATTHLPLTTLWFGGLLAILAQAGDLLESAMKRQAGVKDSGSLLPGHGGVLDRIDGALPVLIVVAALVANGMF